MMETDQIADRKRHHQERDVRSSKGQEQHWGRCQPLGETAMDGRRGWAQSALSLRYTPLRVGKHLSTSEIIVLQERVTAALERSSAARTSWVSGTTVTPACRASAREDQANVISSRVLSESEFTKRPVVCDPSCSAKPSGCMR